MKAWLNSFKFAATLAAGLALIAASLAYAMPIRELWRAGSTLEAESRSDSASQAWFIAPNGPQSGGERLAGAAPTVTPFLSNSQLQTRPRVEAAGAEPADPPAPTPGPQIPARLVIPAIGLDAPVIPAGTLMVEAGGQLYRQWQAPDERAAGWHPDSAPLGVPGNTVLNGHHNIYGEVFRDLVDLEPGDLILVFSFEGRAFSYVIANKMILPEKYETLDVRMDNARWLQPSQDERLTLITCWPYTNNTHRLILVASPVKQ